MAKKREQNKKIDKPVSDNPPKLVITESIAKTLVSWGDQVIKSKGVLAMKEVDELFRFFEITFSHPSDEQKANIQDQ